MTSATCSTLLLLFISGTCLTTMSSIPTAAATRTTYPSLIMGQVLDQQSQPAAGFRVYAQHIGVPMAAIIPEVDTDPEGRFAFRGLRWGKYGLDAGKPSAGYPDGYVADFYTSSTTPVVTLSPATPKAQVLIRLGPKPGVLRGTVLDADTLSPIGDAVANLVREQPSHRTLSTSLRPTFDLFVPSGVRVEVSIGAPGYANWNTTIRMSPGENRVRNVRLRRVAQ